MARMIWKKRSWWRRLAHLRRAGGTVGIPLDHGLFPGTYFQEKLLQERSRAFRSNKPLVVMVLDAEKIGYPGNPGKITHSLSEAVNSCVRESDICGLLKQDVLVGVILTEVEAEKVGAAQQVVENKTREKLDRLLSHELAEQVAITFHIFPTAGAGALYGQGPPGQVAAGGQNEG